MSQAKDRLARILSKLLEGLLVVFGVPRGESPAFYRDILLALFFVVASIVLIVKLIEGTIDRAFWCCFATAVVTLAAARHKSGLVLALFLIVASRLAFAAFVWLLSRA